MHKKLFYSPHTRCSLARRCKQTAGSMLLQLLSCHFPQQQLKSIACLNVGVALLADRIFYSSTRHSFSSAAGLASAAAAHLLTIIAGTLGSTCGTCRATGRPVSCAESYILQQKFAAQRMPIHPARLLHHNP
jgi:hypothetical protein